MKVYENGDIRFLNSHIAQYKDVKEIYDKLIETIDSIEIIVSLICRVNPFRKKSIQFMPRDS